MDISVLQEFYILAEKCSYSATAKQLFITQSSLSKHIQSLERELDTRLFVRDSRNVRLTAAGRLFADHVGTLLQDYEDALRDLSEHKSQMSSVLNVGFIVGTTSHYISKACALFLERAPGVDLHLNSLTVEGVVEALQSGRVDLGVTLVLLEAIPVGMGFSQLECEQFGVLMSRKHRLSKRESLSTHDLEQERILIPDMEVYPTIGLATKLRLNQANPNLTLVPGTQDIETIGPQLIANASVTLTYSSVARFYASEYAFLPIDDVDIPAATGVMWKESRENANISLFLNCLDDALASSK